MKTALLALLLSACNLIAVDPLSALKTNPSTGVISGNAFDAATFKSANSLGSGSGTVTSVSVTTASGVSGSVATSTTTPAITLSLGAITPTSVNGITLSGAGGSVFTLASGKTLTSSNTLTLAGTDGSTLNIGTGSALSALGANSSTSASFSNVDASFHSVNGIFLTAFGGSFANLSVTKNKTFSATNTLTLSGTDSTTMTFPGTSATIARTDAAQTFTGDQSFAANILTTTSGKTLSVKSGSNAKAGTFTLTAGTATVSNTSVTANSVIMVTVKTVSGTRVGNPDIVPTASTGFVATGGVSDTSTYNWVAVEVN